MGSNPTAGTKVASHIFRAVSISTWLADAAQAQVRRRRLREALAVVASEEGALDSIEIDRLIADARRTSRVITGAKGAV